MAYAQESPLNAHVDVTSGVRDIYINPGLSLHLNLYFVYASNEGSDESAHMCRHARAFATR